MNIYMDQASPPHRPMLVKAINSLGNVAKKLGITLPSLNEQKLVEKACKKTGLSDFGDDGFRVGMRRFLRALEEEAELNTMGRLIAESDIVKYLSNRLKFEYYAKLHPDVRTQEVSRPIFIVGLPRTGTTILFNLLAMDPTTRAPLSWEIQNPFPPPREETYRSDARIAECAEEFATLNRIEPRLISIHGFDAQWPQECIHMYRHAFLSLECNVSYKVPGYYEWLKSQDIIPALRFHKQFLQHLQYHYKKERWVLKSPAHLPYIEEIFKVYPDACVIHTHRDPLKVAASATSLAYTVQSIGSDKVDAHATGEQQMDLCEYSINKAMEARKKLGHKNNQIIDVYYEDIVNDPFVTIQKIYDKFGIEFNDDAEKLMREFLANNPQGKHGKHHYSLEMFGLDKAKCRERFSAYCDMFNIKTID